MLKYLLPIIVLALILGFFIYNKSGQQVATSGSFPPIATATNPQSTSLSRITKKHFGTYVTPNNSPVLPEKFTGYHTGIDFETLATKQEIDVAVKAICTGRLLLEEYASGYGGVAVQSCNVETRDVTIVYGHVKPSSIKQRVGEIIESGSVIGILGKGYSADTDGERKHLHLGIYKGAQINIKGYVQNKSELTVWLDAEQLLNEKKISDPL